jgi:beta-lactamase regulating signal transducer with metallopeptidase domain
MDTTLIAAFRFAADIAVKATLLFASAGIALLVLRRRPASERHLVGTLALASAILFPLLGPLLPRLRVDVPLLPAPVVREAAPALAEAPEPAAPALAGTERHAAKARAARVESPAIEPDEALASASAARDAIPAASAPKRSAGWALPLPAIAALLGAWCAVSLVLLARLAVGVSRVRRFRRRGLPVADEDWTRLARSLEREVSLPRSVPLIWCERVPVAVTAGLRRPVLLLPESAQRWDAPRRRVVLLHELAHVARRDWPALLLAEIAVAIYWFHPLAWILARRLRRDAERAADDRVLAAGTKPSVYAGHLLGIFRSLAPEGRPLAAVGMARPSHFEERLRSILDPALRRKRVGAPQAVLTAAVFLGVAATLAVVQPWAARCAEAALPAEFPEADTVAAPMAVAAAPARSASRRTTCPHSLAPAAPKPGPIPAAAASRLALAADAPEPELPAPAPAALETLEPLSEATVPEAPLVSNAGWTPSANQAPRDGKRWFARAWTLHAEERWADAADAFTRAYEEGYRRDTAAYNAACGFARDGQKDAAFAWLAKAAAEGFDVLSHLSHDDDLENLQGDPRLQDLKQQLRQARVASRSEEAAQLADRFRRLAEEYPHNAKDLYGVGKELLDAQSYELAAQAFRLSARAGIKSDASLYNAACAYALAGNRARALDYLRQSIEGGFDDAGLIRKDEDLDSIRSEPRFRELLALADSLELDTSDGGWKKAGSRERQEWSDAARAYEKVARTHPEVGRAWFNLGFASLASGDAARSAEAFEKALALHYREATSLYNLACANARLGRKDQAFEALFEALRRGFGNKSLLRDDDDLASLRGDPRFREALRMAGKGLPEKTKDEES